MFKFAIRYILPKSIRTPLWGNREKWGLAINEDDPDWKEWRQNHIYLYDNSQRAGVGLTVNDAGYRIMSQIDLAEKTVLEIGPGDIRHVIYWNNKPSQYLLADVSVEMLKKAETKLTDAHVTHKSLLIHRGEPLPLYDASVDVVVTFYSLEHIYPLEPYLEEIKRVLKQGGLLIGAIPTEGGLAWGLGRMLTTRKWFKRHTTIDPDKLICWEHPNFSDQIIYHLDRYFVRRQLRFWPFSWLPFLDNNLLISLIYQKKG